MEEKEHPIITNPKEALELELKHRGKEKDSELKEGKHKPGSDAWNLEREVRNRQS